MQVLLQELRPQPEARPVGWGLLRQGAMLEVAEGGAAGLQLWQRGIVASIVPRTTGAAS